MWWRDVARMVGNKYWRCMLPTGPAGPGAFEFSVLDIKAVENAFAVKG
jgi:hypothetical protein